MAFFKRAVATAPAEDESDAPPEGPLLPADLEELGFSSDEAGRILRLGRDLAARGDWGQAEEAVRRAREADVSRLCTVEIDLLALRVALGRANVAGAREALDRLSAAAPEDRTSFHRALRVIEDAAEAPVAVREELAGRLREAVGALPNGNLCGHPSSGRMPKVAIPPALERDTLDDLESDSAGAGEDGANPVGIGVSPPAFDDGDAAAAMEAVPLPALDDEATDEVVDEESPGPVVGEARSAEGKQADLSRTPVLDVDPFEDPDAYMRPHVSAGGAVAASISRPSHIVPRRSRRSRGSREPVPPVLPSHPIYEASADVRRHRESGATTDAQDLLRRFVQEQVGGAAPGGGPVPREEAEHLYDLGTTLLTMAPYEGAKTVFDQAMQHPDFQVPASEGLLQAMVTLGENEAAQMMGRLALQAYGKNGVSLIGLRYWFARAAEAQGHVNPAFEMYEEVVSEDPGYEDSAERLERLQAAR